MAFPLPFFYLKNPGLSGCLIRMRVFSTSTYSFFPIRLAMIA
jgi:hypothetical protein